MEDNDYVKIIDEKNLLLDEMKKLINVYEKKILEKDFEVGCFKSR
jgi:hypothetical protein